MMASLDTYSPLHVFPREIWELIFQYMRPSTFEAFRHAIPELYTVISPAQFSQKLFPVVFKTLYENHFVRPDTVRTCRRVCSDWKNGVDDFFQKTNFHCLANKNVPENCSGFLLNMPIELLDMYRIQYMQLHPGCVSFGKKLTLLMRRDHRIPEVDLLLRGMTTFWEKFEQLEVRQLDEYPDLDRIPDEFEKYIPFLHLMTKLKKVTLRLSRRWVNIRILLYIPQQASLEEIYIEHRGLFVGGVMSHCCAVTLYHVAKSVKFLAGVNSACIRLYADWINMNNDPGPVFEKLKEIHIYLDHKWTQTLVDDLSDSNIHVTFPVVTTLVIYVKRRFPIMDLWKSLGIFANKFPCLQHFSLSGDCVPDQCVYFKTISENQHANIESNYAFSSVLTTFQFQCPLHVPTGLLKHFPSVKHIIIEECPERCHLHESIANDCGFVSSFFMAFSNVTTLSFVPVLTDGQTRDASTSFKKVTHFRGDTKYHVNLAIGFGKLNL